MDPYQRFQQELVEAGLLLPSGVRGVYGRSGIFEHVIERFEAFIGREAREQAREVWRFPPVFPRADYEELSHIHNFPQLLGSVHSFAGGDREHAAMVGKLLSPAEGQHWTDDLSPAAVMLVPAACYPLYRSATGRLSEEGRTVDLQCFVFRHEPSDDPARMQIFRQREVVRLGTATQALEHRDLWLQRGQEMLEALGLPVQAVVANDPFFGRGGRLAKATQREQALKFELVVPICSVDQPTAVASSNYHTDYFGQTFKIEGPDGGPAHTACIGFGLERVALALFKTHGLEPRSWPIAVREKLGLEV